MIHNKKMLTRSQSKNGDPLPWNDIPVCYISHEEIEAAIELFIEDGAERAGVLEALAIDYDLDPVAYEAWCAKNAAIGLRMYNTPDTAPLKAPAQQRAEEAWGTEDS